MQTKILYVEDEPFLGKIVKETLELKGFTVQWTQHGNEVIGSFHKDKPDVVVLDVMLPGRDGFSLGTELRTIDPRIPIIFLTAKDQLEDVAKGFSSGGTDYLRKPFSVEELIIRIHNQLNILLQSRLHTPIEERESEIGIRDFVFLPGRYELCRHDRCVKLSHREAQILGMLALHQNKTIDRKHMLLEVWGDDSFFNSRNLDVYIRKLREYFSDDPEIQIITLKGKGYHFLVGNS